MAGANGLVGVLVAAATDLPLIDGDCVGRGLPELQMNTPNLADVPCSPAYLIDKYGSATLEVSCPTRLEKMARTFTKSGDNNAALVFNLMQTPLPQNAIATKTLSRAVSLGHSLMQQKLPQSCKVLTEGIITKIDLSIKNGFLMGTFCVQSKEEHFSILVKNEIFCVRKADAMLTRAPTIISCLHHFEPLASDALRVGMPISIVTLPASHPWNTEPGRSIVQKGFGLAHFQ